MKNTILFLPGFHLQTLRRTPRSASQELRDELTKLTRKSFAQLSECFGPFIPTHLLCPSASGALSRQRVFSKANTFWAFFSQVLDADGGCQEVVRKLQAFAAMKVNAWPSSSTTAYGQARKKLDLPSLAAILPHTAHWLQATLAIDRVHGRRVVVVDGTGVSMPDTAANQQVWPQQRNQKPVCGFSHAFLCACLCLRTGALLSYEMGDKKSHELPLMRKQWSIFKPGDIFWATRDFAAMRTWRA